MTVDAPADPDDDRDSKSEYEAHKERARDRSAEASKKGREIGDIPGIDAPLPAAAKKRRNSTRTNFTRFCEIYKSELFYLPAAPAHKTLDRKIQEVMLGGGNVPIAMPRGMGKSSKCEAALEWAVLHAHRLYPILIGANETSAQDILAAIRLDLETNELLAEDFPEVCLPIRALEGIPQRRLLHHGRQVRILLDDAQIALPWIEGSAAAGARIKATGLMSAFRGSRVKLPDGRSIRPDVVLLDDPQTRESARSSDQTHKRERIIMGDVMGLGGPGKKISVLMPCTVIEEGDLADRFLNPLRHPDWDAIRIKMLESFPADMELWQQYAEIRAEGLRTGQGLKPATAFYKKHRKPLDRGAKVSWPDRFNDDELSAIQHAMNLYFKDPIAFAAEYQNEPLLDVPGEAIGIPTKDAILARTNGLSPRLVPSEADHLVAFIDVQLACLFYVVVAWRSDFTGAFVDYGVWPDQKRRHFTLREVTKTLAKEAPGAGEDGAIFQGLDQLTQELFGREWMREDGGHARLSLCLVDANWKSETIRTFCRRSRFGAGVLPVHGRYISASSRPISETPRKKGQRVGEEWRTDRFGGQLHIVYDTNYWKTFLHDRLAIPFGDAGNLTLCGAARDRERHDLFADHLVAEYRVRVTSSKGRSVDEYKQRPDRRDNHWLDGAVGCCVAGSMLGCKLPHARTRRAKAPPKPLRDDAPAAVAPKRKPKRRGGGGVSYG